MLEVRCNRHELSDTEMMAKMKELEDLDKVDRKKVENEKFSKALLLPRKEATRRRNHIKM